MLSLSNFVMLSNCSNFPRALIFYPKAPPTHFKISSRNVNFLSLGAVFIKIPSGVRSTASKIRSRGDANVLEKESFEEEEDDEDFNFLDEDFDDGDFAGGADDGDEVIIPLRDMKKWLENKPLGFGEGKEYDTSIEDKLMEEIEQSRNAKLANINKLKNSPDSPSSRKNERAEKIKDVEEGHRVRLVNLPKKKNIHKDLRLAFRGVPGLINIVPSVFGNKKTRDPVCKGLAFLNFKSEDEALRFVQTYSGQNIAFGKVQKQIRCELLDSNLTKSAEKQSVEETFSASQVEPPRQDGELDATCETEIPLVISSEEMASSEYGDANEENPAPNTSIRDAIEEGRDNILQTDMKHFGSEDEYHEGNVGSSGQLESDSDVESIVREESTRRSSMSKLQKKTPATRKTAAPRKKKEKSSKLTIPGSAKRLKVREKAMLTEVFSKYVPTALATNELAK